MQLNARRITNFCTFLIVLLFFVLPSRSEAQNTDQDYEEISVFLAVQGVGGYEITAIYKNDQIYLPVSEMFQVLKINQRTSDYNDTISGFFLDENNKYIISQPGRTVFINGKLIQLSADELMNTETTSLALRIDQYGKLFGLDCKFDFSSLSVELKTNLELPIIKELRLEQMRKNISRLRGEIEVDTTYERKYHIFRGGMADWAIYSTQITGGTTETRGLLGLGAEFLGGETNIELNYSTRSHFDKRQQQYHWRWANNDIKPVKQIIVGKINTPSIASIYSPLIGTIITNTPTSFRRSFGSYTMTDFTEPGWTVELYINNVVVDYTTADAKGFYKFDIPLVYGSSNVVVKFYGPWGEERQKEQTINVPYTFLPKGEMQYTVAGAMLQDSTHSLFTRGVTNFGINRHLTLGGGFEYLSSIISTPSIPFVTGSAQLFDRLLFNGEYAYGVRSKALFSYTSPSNVVLDIDYTKYAKEQKAITFNYLEERKIRASIPISIKKFKAYSRFSYIQNILKETNYSTAEATISTYVKGVSANFTGNANWLKDKDPFIYGNIALGFRFFHSLSFRPQVQYDFSNKDLIFTKVELEQNFSPKCNLSLVWENNVRSNINTVEVTFRYDLSFVQTSVNTRVSKDYVMTGQSARGSFAFGSGNGRVIADTRTKVGSAGITVIPFLDVNNNNRRDDDEPITSGMDLRINGGRILSDSKDSIIRIIDLEPFASYMLEFNDTRFDNIAWQIKNKTISILMDPNQFKLLEVPIKVMGEINGMVFLKTGTSVRAQGRVQINVFDENGNFVAKTQSESDGYYNYLGLGPGRYFAQVDSLQLSRLRLVSQPERVDFEIQATTYGDIIDNIEFQLLRQDIEKQEITLPELAEAELLPIVISEIPVAIKEVEKTEPIVKDTIAIIAPFEVTVKKTDSSKFFVQAGAFKIKSNADRLVKDLSKLTSKKWFIDNEDGFYKVRLGYFDSKDQAIAFEKDLNTPDISYYISEIPVKSASSLAHKESVKTEQKQEVTQQISLTTEMKNEAAVTAPMDCEDSLHVQNGYFVQAGAFAIKANAEKLTAKLIATTGQNWFIACGKGLYKVRLGYFTNKSEAREVEKSLRNTGIAFYVNKPTDAEISTQTKKVTEITEQKQKAVPVPTPELKEPKAVTPVVAETKIVAPLDEVSNAAKKTEVPPAIKVVPETKKDTEKVEEISKVKVVPAPAADEVTDESVPSKYFIQAGAFDSQAHAERLAQDLLALTLKRWFITYDNGLYKVRLGYFTTKEAARFIEGTLNTTEVPYYVGSVPINPATNQKANDSEQKDQKQKSRKERKQEKKEEANSVTTPDQDNSKPAAETDIKTRRNAVVVTPPSDNDNAATGSHKFFIQVEAFSNKHSAEQLASDMQNKTRREWFVVFEDNLYKVRLGYFDSKDEAKYAEGTLNTPDISYYIDEIPAENSEY